METVKFTLTVYVQVDRTNGTKSGLWCGSDLKSTQFVGRHPERSRTSGGVKDLGRITVTSQDSKLPAGTSPLGALSGAQPLEIFNLPIQDYSQLSPSILSAHHAQIVKMYAAVHERMQQVLHDCFS
jgi:hypothetical protein